jgi:phage gp36-like protein
MASLASISDLQARHDVTDEVRAQAALDDASNLIAAETHNSWAVGVAPLGAVNSHLVPLDVDGLLTAVPSIVVTVCCAVAARALRNPLGVLSEQIDDYTVRHADAGTGVYLTKAERRMLATLRTASGLSSIGVTRDIPGSATTYLDTYYPSLGRAGEPIPFEAL